MDFETDPFDNGVIPEPFCVGFTSEFEYHHFWGSTSDVIDWTINHIRSLPPKSIVYAHNGGKFDYHYLVNYLQGKLVVINGRIAKGYIEHVEIRDSYALLPFPLRKLHIDGKYKKDIDYNKLRRSCRDQHREEILDYLKADCDVLFAGVSRFVKEFGLHLTMASASMKELQKITPTEKLNSNSDKMFRKYYYGGRVQVFERGIRRVPWKMYDVNSMYPYAMKSFEHPVSNRMFFTTKLEEVDFAIITARNDNCLPSKNEDGSLVFNQSYGRFHATGHEIRTGLQLGRLKINKVHIGFRFADRMTFADFIDHFYNLRLEASAQKDEAMKLFYKFIMNGAYGKFAQDPSDFKDWQIFPGDEAVGDGWTHFSDFDGVALHCRPTRQPRHIYLFNVATAASITGAARSILMRGIHAARRPLYCDTDSLICEDLPLEIDDAKLGAWKFEGNGDEIAIAGKKLYALFKQGRGEKKASKGANLSFDEIRAVAGGSEIVYKNAAPTFKLGMPAPHTYSVDQSAKSFISRRIRST